MLNRRPIFINAFARGGSNILMNLLLSHPDVCLAAGETSKVFKGRSAESRVRRYRKRLAYDIPIMVLTGSNLFATTNHSPRPQVSKFAQRYIDRILHDGRFTVMGDAHNRFKSEGVPYTHEELAECRLLAKGLDGVVFTTDMFEEMYPDAVHFGLVRNGLAICESLARYFGHSPERSGKMYKTVADKMIEYSERMPSYHLVKFEELSSDPVDFLGKVYAAADLDIELLEKARLQSKTVTGPDGQRTRSHAVLRQMYWSEVSDLPSHIKSDVTANQIRLLSDENKERFLAVAGSTMEKLGYL